MNLPPLPELPEPDDTDDTTYAAHSADQLRAYALSYGRAVQEACARVCEDVEAGDGSHDYNAGAATMQERVVAAIRNGVLREGEGE